MKKKNMTIALCDSDHDTFVSMRKIWDGPSFNYDIRHIKDSDVWVSPANGLGWMDGGIDAIYSNHFHKQGIDIQSKVQEAIRNSQQWGVLKPGRALLIETGGSPKYLIPAVTMIVPTVVDINIHKTIFYAAKNATHVAKFSIPEDDIKIVFPGLGTGAVGVEKDVAISLMVGGIKSELA